MGATENAGFNAKVQRNLGLDFVIKQRKSLQKLQPVYSLLLLLLLHPFNGLFSGQPG